MTALVRLIVLAGATAYVIGFWILVIRAGILTAAAVVVLGLVVYGFLQHKPVEG